MVPFHSLWDTEISYKVIQGERPVMPTKASESGIPDGLWQLLLKRWNHNYSKHPQINEVLRHLSQAPALGLFFPPPNVPRAPAVKASLPLEHRDTVRACCRSLPNLAWQPHEHRRCVNRIGDLLPHPGNNENSNAKPMLKQSGAGAPQQLPVEGAPQSRICL